MAPGASRNSSATPCSASSPSPARAASPWRSKSRKSTASSACSMAAWRASPDSSRASPCSVTEVCLRAINAGLAVIAAAAALFAQTPPAERPDAAYVLGPEDQLTLRVLDLEEVPDKPFRVDMRGNINVPLIGRVHAGGLTVEQLEATLTGEFGKVLNSATVTVFMTEFRSQPISVLGAVRTPGVHQIRGHATLYELLSLAGGLNPDA